MLPLLAQFPLEYCAVASRKRVEQVDAPHALRVVRGPPRLWYPRELRGAPVLWHSPFACDVVPKGGEMGAESLFRKSNHFVARCAPRSGLAQFPFPDGAQSVTWRDQRATC